METIRIITPDDVEAFRDIRLEALRNSPESFGSSYEEESKRGIEQFKERIAPTSNHYVLGAFSIDNHLLGVVGFRQEQSMKEKHKGFIWGMYVRPDSRGRGVGRKLFSKVLELSRNVDGLEQINLCVMATNQNAKKLYESVGFEVYGLEKKALKYDGVYYDEELMTYWLVED